MKKKIKLIKYSIIFFLLIFLSIYIYNLFFNIEGFINIQIQKEPEGEYLTPILRLIYDDINYSDNSTELMITRDTILESNKTPYIFMNGEAFNRYDNLEYFNINYNKALNDKLCIACILTTTDVEPNDKTFYVPFFLNRGRQIFTSTPFTRKYLNNPRTRLAAYIATHSPPHRDQFFKTLYNLDTTRTTDGLGSANHTRDVQLPKRNEGWWNLIEIYKDYKFGFAMENVNEDGYITEKIMNVYIGGAIPIYWGTNKVKTIFNPDSFVYVNDYPSFEDCAKDIIAISNDKERYNNMRNAPIFLPNQEIDYSSYWDVPPPEWVVNIANNIKNRLNM